MVKRILVGLGGTPYSAVATKRALELAKAHGAEVTAVTILNEEKLRDVGDGFYARKGGTGFTGEDRIAYALELLEGVVSAFVESCEKEGIAYRVRQETEEPFAKLIRHSHYHDLTIVGLRALFDYGLVDEPSKSLVRLVREGVRPILAVSEKWRLITRALVLHDGSMEASCTLKRFAPMHLWPNVELKILCFRKPSDEAGRVLASAGAYCRAHGYSVETESIFGLRPTQLVSHAREWGADLIVMGNSARKVWTQSILGDTVETVIRNAERPIFLAQ